MNGSISKATYGKAWTDFKNVHNKVRIPSPRLSNLTNRITRNRRRKLLLNGVAWAFSVKRLVVVKGSSPPSCYLKLKKKKKLIIRVVTYFFKIDYTMIGKKLERIESGKFLSSALLNPHNVVWCGLSFNVISYHLLIISPSITKFNILWFDRGKCPSHSSLAYRVLNNMIIISPTLSERKRAKEKITKMDTWDSICGCWSRMQGWSGWWNLSLVFSHTMVMMNITCLRPM